MTEQSTSHRGTRLLIIAAACVIILYGINQAQSVVVLFLVSAFLAVIGTVPVLWMEGKHVPTVAAVLIVLTAMVTLLLSIGVVVGASLSEFSNALPFYQTRIHDRLFELKALLAGRGIIVTDTILLGYVNPAAVMDFTAALFTSLGSVLSNIVLILFTVLFILLEASSFPAKLRSVLVRAVHNDNSRSDGKGDTTCHPTVEPPDVEPKAELRLCRRDPLQHMPMTYKEAEECADDGVSH